MPRLPQKKMQRLPDHRLPVYTVIAALYREAKSVGPLMQAIDAFDYPREKLQVILALEPNDLATRAAIARLGPMPHVQVLIASATGPQTKPKALNCALPFARGSFTAVFDAEDRPDPGQLRAALDAFRSHDTDVACAQASLCIDNNTKDSWLSRTFAAEYAGQFDVFLPGLAAMRMPLPLGGSSNHFRTAVLREVGGWDAWNVTEDADLGFRLARFGYRSVTFNSTTNEEAPIRFKAWLGQRSRWMKGWMQTWGVHMREPRRLWRQAGPRGFFTLNIIVGGNVLTALAYPVLVIELAAHLLASITGSTSGLFFTGSLAPLHIATDHSRLCVDRPDRPDGAGPARPPSQRLGSGADALLLGLSCRSRHGVRCGSFGAIPIGGKRPSTASRKAGHRRRRRVRRRLRIRCKRQRGFQR